MGFRGIMISSSLWLTKELTIEQKFILAEIHSYCSDTICVLVDGHFERIFNIEHISVMSSLQGLIDQAFISVSNNDDSSKVYELLHKSLGYLRV